MNRICLGLNYLWSENWQIIITSCFLLRGPLCLYLQMFQKLIVFLLQAFNVDNQSWNVLTWNTPMKTFSKTNIKICYLRKHLNQLCGVANIWSCAKWLTLCGTLVDERNECFGDSNAHWCETPLYLAAVVWLCQILTSCFSEFKKTGGVFVGTLFDKKVNTLAIL